MVKRFAKAHYAHTAHADGRIASKSSSSACLDCDRQTRSPPGHPVRLAIHTQVWRHAMATPKEESEDGCVGYMYGWRSGVAGHLGRMLAVAQSSSLACCTMPSSAAGIVSSALDAWAVRPKVFEEEGL